MQGQWRRKFSLTAEYFLVCHSESSPRSELLVLQINVLTARLTSQRVEYGSLSSFSNHNTTFTNSTNNYITFRQSPTGGSQKNDNRIQNETSRPTQKITSPLKTSHHSHTVHCLTKTHKASSHTSTGAICPEPSVREIQFLPLNNHTTTLRHKPCSNPNSERFDRSHLSGVTFTRISILSVTTRLKPYPNPNPKRTYRSHLSGVIVTTISTFCHPTSS